ncbi:unnamed protein product, partial [Rotaria sordida]
IKLHGQRIELGEIEQCLLNTLISACVVIKWDDDHLVSYVQSTNIDVEELRKHCQSHLPPHMIPSIFVVLEKLPINANGKIDRKLLPAPQFSLLTNIDQTDVIPLTPLEEHLQRIFSEAFHNESPNVNMPFGQLGGTSLDVIRALMLIQQEICTKVDVGLLFANPSIRQLARVIEPLLVTYADSSVTTSALQLLQEWNLYGPAETTIDCAFHLVDISADTQSVPIGRALPRYRCLILDDFLQAVVISQEGALYVGGVGVFAGYLEREELTTRALIVIDDEIFYRTGDLVRMDKNGFLHYQGRKDHQIKLHGQRIELGEIEQCLLNTLISACVVIKWDDDHLVSYVQS